MNSIVETGWRARGAPVAHRTKGIPFILWFRDAIKPLGLIVAPPRGGRGFWETFILARQHALQHALQQRNRAAEQSAKDEFFGGGFANRKSIPARTWKRHSAFLVYRQHMRDLTTQRLTKPDPENSRAAGRPAIPTRMSFQVKSITHLPVWAIGLDGLGLMENEWSSLILMEPSAPENPVAEAA